ncbi:helix-turn-helix domain-containing protein [Paenibacillus sp. BIC5C1]|uniref:helix-turn-helix domain-containing protein n=1 Tax=Paenibacillus sp. BIC5C1 TaxID=3078263 RepID=UPI0028E39793|nr:helix-turn-helix domain-containing protein [Paenibacillus sp. BIC5C1]
MSKMSGEFDKTLKFLYQSTLIPTYVYVNHQCVVSYPVQDVLTLPPLDYTSQLVASNEQVSYLSTSFFAYYGAIQVSSSPDTVIIVGPVSQIPYLKDTLRIMKKEFVISASDEVQFEVFLKWIPPMQLQQFLNHLLSIHYFVNGEELEYFDLLKLESLERINHKQTERNYENKESRYFNNSYEIENQMCSYVESGNEAGLRRFLERPFVTHEGITASDSLRQAKNIYIVTITLATRAAIRGSLDTEIAYQLSDLYIQQIEQLPSLEAIQNFAKEAIFNFARRVQGAKYNIPVDHSMSRIIQYVFKSVNQPLTATHIAQQFGYSRTHLSTVFKKNVGTSLHQFIVDCKLKEAQHLLVFTNKPISEISSYLCFSSQSHFQTVFKRAVHLSPLQYRKHHQGIHSG